MANGRGAWNTAGVGGTKKYKDANKPGPYYYTGSGTKPAGRNRNSSEYAVYRAVIAYQRALNREVKADLPIDGVFGARTSEAVSRFQEANVEKTGTPWGGVGPETSQALLRPRIADALKNPKYQAISTNLISGTVRHESLWDPGAIGYLDPDDVGLAQINHQAHPEYTNVQRLTPLNAFTFIANYYVNALASLDGNVRDAVASYNLGSGGVRSWIAAGRPDSWTPPGSSRARDVKGYIDSILAG